jgi:hypothetical protein
MTTPATIAKSLELTEAELIQLWESDETTGRIAARLVVQKKWLTDSWYRLKRTGKIPRKTRRADAADNSGFGPDDSIDKAMDATAALLERLKEAHGEPRYDIHPGVQQTPRPKSWPDERNRKVGRIVFLP